MKKNFDIPESWSEMSKVFTALGDQNRQRILLLFDPNETLTAGQIADESVLARTTISHHLKILREAGVLTASKHGKEVWFKINKDILQMSLENCLDYIKTNA